MKKKVQLIVPVLFLGMLAMFWSCDKEDETLTAYGDAFISTISRGDTVYYGLNLYAYSYYRMDEVKVSLLNKTFQVTLDTLQYRYTHASIPGDDDYTLTPPDSGTYVFDAFFDDGSQHTSADFLDTAVIFPPVVTEAVFDTTNQQFMVKWESVCDKCGYRVMLINESKKVVFQTDLLNYDQNAFSITPYTYGWGLSTQPLGGETYSVVVMAFMFEAAASSFDLQCISTNNENEFTWEYENYEE
jgi:hypothetical protein